VATVGLVKEKHGLEEFETKGLRRIFWPEKK
jgi:hypothetical protein